MATQDFLIGSYCYQKPYICVSMAIMHACKLRAAHISEKYAAVQSNQLWACSGCTFSFHHNSIDILFLMLMLSMTMVVSWQESTSWKSTKVKVYPIILLLHTCTLSASRAVSFTDTTTNHWTPRCACAQCGVDNIIDTTTNHLHMCSMG